METLKEIAIDILIIVSVWFLVTAEGIATQAKGLSCGNVREAPAQKQP